MNKIYSSHNHAFLFENKIIYVLYEHFHNQNFILLKEIG